ncbi:NERD domain-containing protein kinase family protein [Shewanella algae]|uniref:NERD domain-containing protein kinase family protein n=1 Tax=Shewanella algae TaxID=38313 RepID=UPI0031F5B338
MAKHISFGTPVNDAERWAFELLGDELPKDYLLLTNIEIPTQSGQAMEVDALVVGEWGVYVIDVKGYIGRLNAGLHAWSLDGREVDNSLSKANYVARVLAGKLKNKIPVGVYAPWCQGMVFVTGHKGEAIELEKQDGALSIYTPRQIIAALTKEWGLTAPHKHQINQRQKEAVLDTLGQVALVEQRNNKIQDFIKLKCLFLQSGLEVWQAEYNPGGWTAPWLLKILIPTHFEQLSEARQHEEQLRGEFQRLQKLSGCSGVPYSAPLIQDGEQLVLPIRMPRGVPIHLLEIERLSIYQLLEILRRGATSLSQIHRRNICVGGWDEHCLFIGDDGEVEFIDIRDDISIDEDLRCYAERFLPLALATHQPRIYLWFQRVAAGRGADLDELRADLSALIETGVCDSLDSDTEIAEGSVIDHHFRLEEVIYQAAHSELWRATHLQGQFDVGLSVYRFLQQDWPGLNHQYRSLSRIYHPNVERVLAFGELGGSDRVFIARAWERGVALDCAEIQSPQQVIDWFRQLLTALQYLHRLDIFHRAICPKNIVCNGDSAVLLNFGLGQDIAARHYAAQYADPDLWALEGDAERDLYGLVASFIDVLTPIELKGDAGPSGMLRALDAFDPRWLGESLFAMCHKVLRFEVSLADNADYLPLFGFKR